MIKHNTKIGRLAFNNAKIANVSQNIICEPPNNPNIN